MKALTWIFLYLTLHLVTNAELRKIVILLRKVKFLSGNVWTKIWAIHPDENPRDALYDEDVLDRMGDKALFTSDLNTIGYVSLLLPPASEGWRRLYFSLCVSVHTSTGGGGGRAGTSPFQVRSQDGGGVRGACIPPSRSDPRMGAGGGGYPHPHPGQIPGQGGRYPPIQVRS